MGDEEPLEIGEIREIAPGVLIERRCLLATLAAFLSVSAAPGPRALGLKDGRDRLSFEEFLASVVPRARILVADTSRAGQDRYLRYLARFATRLADVTVPSMNGSGQGAGPGTFIGFNPGGDPFTVLHWRMDPFAEIRTHAHTYGNVMSLGLEGAAFVENFEVVGPRDFTTHERFLARRTVHARLGRRDVNLVNLERNYIHGMTAGRTGARGLDITTRLRSKEPTPYLILERPHTNLSRARWVFD